LSKYKWNKDNKWHQVGF